MLVSHAQWCLQEPAYLPRLQLKTCHPALCDALYCREFELTCGQPAAGADLGGGLRLSPAVAAAAGSALDAAAQEELAALSLDPPSALTPELQQLQGQDQVRVRGLRF